MKGETAILKFKKLSPRASAPVRSSDKAAGYDLRSACQVVVPAKARALCLTDIQVCLPPGCYGRIAPRSGLALKHGIDVGGGVIDQDYRGNIGIILFNHSEKDFEVNEGDRIAQLICEKVCYPKVQEVTELDDTERGSNGFGSTGTK